jgi:hypothetical protein
MNFLRYRKRLYYSLASFVSLTLNFILLWKGESASTRVKNGEEITFLMEPRTTPWSPSIAHTENDKVAQRDEATAVHFPIKYLVGITSLGGPIFTRNFLLQPKLKDALGVTDEEERAFLDLAAVEFNKIRNLEKSAVKSVVNGDDAYFVFPIAPQAKQEIRNAVVQSARITMGSMAGDAVKGLIPFDDWFGRDDLNREVSYYVDSSGSGGVEITWRRQDGRKKSSSSTASRSLNEESAFFQRYGHVIAPNSLDDNE